jgi:phospholipase/carboxylesterase
MTETTEPRLIKIQDWPFRVKPAEQLTNQPRILLLLHGYLGNENIAWILTKSIPKVYTILAPRAPIKLGPDQYSWHPIEPQWPGLFTTYKKLAREVLQRVDQWVLDQHLNVDTYDVMGFSQGAVMAYGLSFLFPERINKIAALAGFIPQSWQADLSNVSLSGESYFIAHGTQDETVPFEKAEQAAEFLKEKGAAVTFCEANTGHKFGANCFSSLGEFFR